MPYDPRVVFNAQPLYQGLADMGEGLQRAKQNKQQMDALETAATLIAKQHPDAVDPDMLEKFSKGSLGQRQALVGQMTAAVADKYKQQQMTMEQQNIDTHRYAIDVKNAREIAQEKQQERQQNFIEGRYLNEQNAEPNTFTDANGNTFMYMPGSKQTPQQTNKKEMMLPEPQGDWQEHNGPDGKPVAKSRWNPYTGKTEIISLREPAGNPLAALLGGGVSAGGDASASAGTAAPAPAGAAPAAAPQPTAQAPAPAAKPQFQPGKVYQGKDGSKARYNADGSWTRIP